jgi:tetratricopeptide (TPR) repeat protein
MKTHAHLDRTRAVTRLAVLSAALLLPAALLLVNLRAADADAERTATPRELYNDGTEKLRAGKFTDAETYFQNAIAVQDPRVQPAALYNLGVTRFKDGDHERTNSPDPERTAAAAAHSMDNAGDAMSTVAAALESDDVNAMVQAYLRGRGAQKDLKNAAAAVKAALETDASVLTKWRRASGDFRSTLELQPADQGALTNADLVDRHIAQLVDKMRPLSSQRGAMSQLGGQLRQMLQKLKGKLPQNIGDQMPGDDGEDDGGDVPPKQLKGGGEEGPVKTGSQAQMTQEEAMRLLNMLRLDQERKLPGGGGEPTKPLDRKGRDW